MKISFFIHKNEKEKEEEKCEKDARCRLAQRSQ